MNILRIFFVIINPFTFISYLIFPVGTVSIFLRTPIGKCKVKLRNRESARTLYSIFIRKDYPLNSEQYHIIDLGSNIGLSALYFLTRNKQNTAALFEPDPYNIGFLKENLKPFSNRCTIDEVAVTSIDYKEKVNFNIANDGKYSSLLSISRDNPLSVKVDVKSFKAILKKEYTPIGKDIVVKIDVEGSEMDIIKSIDFRDYRKISIIIVEGKGFAKEINRKCNYQLINGYVEFIKFL